MRCFFRESDMATDRQTRFYDITDEILNYVAESQIRNGQIIIQPLHTTIGIYLNEGEERLMKDFENFLLKKIPFENNYLHDDIGKRKDFCPSDEPINAHSHLKSAFFSNPVISLVIAKGELRLGTYQRILLAEFDGPCPRIHKTRRRYAISIIGE